MLTTWPKPFKYFQDVRRFLISLSVVISIIVSAIFLFRYYNTNELLIERVKEQASSYAHLIILTRHWNAQYGGVYVEKKKGTESNPYLRELGIDPDIKTVDNRSFTLRNPAIMTREISRLAREQNNVQFRIVGLHPINPENTPDHLERQALEQFERGVFETWDIDDSGKMPVFRYIRSLLVEEPCMKCHRPQEYALGDVSGGISIIIPADTLVRQLASNKLQSAVDAAITIGLIVGILYFMTWKLVVRLDKVQKQLKRIAVTDELTGLRNRRYIMEQLEKEHQRAVRSNAPLSLIMLDIDHFKQINDTYGHAFGDQVLKAVADEMKMSLRPYDLLGRIGGEEFLIASPGSAREDAVRLAERIVSNIRAKKIGKDSRETYLTISAGVSALNAEDGSADALFNRADAALYQAKREGRDKVVAL